VNVCNEVMESVEWWLLGTDSDVEGIGGEPKAVDSSVKGRAGCVSDEERWLALDDVEHVVEMTHIEVGASAECVLPAKFTIVGEHQKARRFGEERCVTIGGLARSPSESWASA
jgi:hypothetical protein